MSREKEHVEIIFAGRYNFGELLSGPEKFAKRIFNEHSKNKKSIFIQYFFDGRKYSIKDKLFGHRRSVINSNSEVLTLGLLKIILFIFRIRPRVVHITQFERFTIIIFLLKIFYRHEIIYNSHGCIKHENKILKKVSMLYRLKDNIAEWFLLKFSDRIIFNSQTGKDITKKYYKIDDRKTKIIPHGADEMFFNSSKSNHNKILKCVCIINKNLDLGSIDFLEKILFKIDFEIEFHIITNILVDIGNRNKTRIFFHKSMNSEELASFYLDKDIFLMLNSYETFSMASLETMSSGLLLIAANTAGITEMIQNEVNGFKVNYNDGDKVTSILKNMNENRKRLNELKESSANSIQGYTWKNIYKNYNEIYLSLQ